MERRKLREPANNSRKKPEMQKRRLGVNQDDSTSNMGGNSPCPTEKQKDDFFADLPMFVKRNGSPSKVIDKDGDPSKVADQFLKFFWSKFLSPIP